MNFANAAQKRCHARVSRYLADHFGARVVSDPAEPYFMIEEGSALVTVGVRSWEEHSAIVETYAWVVTEVDRSDDLMQYLLEQNYALRFGAFALDADGDVMFKHVIVGSGPDRATVDPEELHASVAGVLQMADYYDDRIVERFGGMRARDRERGDPSKSPTREGG